MQSCSAVLFQFEDIICSHYYTLDFSTVILPHAQSGWEFILVKSGELTYTAGEESVDIKPGSLVISPPGKVHGLTPHGSIIYDRHTFVVSEECMDKEILSRIPRDLCVLDVSNNSMILDIFEKMIYYVSSLQPKQAAAVLRSLGNELMTNIYIATRDSSTAVEPTTSPLIARLLVYINQHIREPLTVPQISEEMSVSAGYLHQHFAKHMHMTLKQYIMRQKLQLMQQALKHNANPTEICRQYGFRNYSTFYRNYQKVYGCSPSEGQNQPLKKIEL